MPEQRHLSNAPVVEAIIDFRCQTGVAITSDSLKSLQGKIGYDGAMQELNEMTFAFEANPTAPAPKKPESRLQGGRFTSIDSRQVAQLRANGCTISRLAPYTSWDEAFPEAWRIWEIYCKEMRVSNVARIAVRYINRLVLPQPIFSENPSAFLTPPPSLPLGVAGAITQWVTRFVIDDAARGITAAITQASDQLPSPPGQYVLIFDIDVSTLKGITTDPMSLKPRFLELRNVKNAIFFSGVTEAALALFS
jgi:uncharacterized protein (TIGR04255 family)